MLSVIFQCNTQEFLKITFVDDVIFFGAFAISCDTTVYRNFADFNSIYSHIRYGYVYTGELTLNILYWNNVEW